MRYAVKHVTRYHYGAPVDLGYHLLRLVPPTTARQRLVEHAIAITPRPERLGAFVDHFGNGVRHVAIERRHDAFAAELSAVIEVEPSGASPAEGPAWDKIAASMRDGARLLPNLRSSPPSKSRSMLSSVSCAWRPRVSRKAICPAGASERDASMTMAIIAPIVMSPEANR